MLHCTLETYVYLPCHTSLPPSRTLNVGKRQNLRQKDGSGRKYSGAGVMVRYLILRVGLLTLSLGTVAPGSSPSVHRCLPAGLDPNPVGTSQYRWTVYETLSHLISINTFAATCLPCFNTRTCDYLPIVSIPWTERIERWVSCAVPVLSSCLSHHPQLQARPIPLFSTHQVYCGMRESLHFAVRTPSTPRSDRLVHDLQPTDGVLPWLDVLVTCGVDLLSPLSTAAISPGDQ